MSHTKFLIVVGENFKEEMDAGDCTTKNGEMETLFAEWSKSWFSTAACSTRAWCVGPQWDSLVGDFGESVALTVIRSLRESEDHFPALQLYDEVLRHKPECRVAGDVANGVISEQDRVRVLLRRWNSRLIRQCCTCGKVHNISCTYGDEICGHCQCFHI